MSLRAGPYVASTLACACKLYNPGLLIASYCTVGYRATWHATHVTLSSTTATYLYLLLGRWWMHQWCSDSDSARLYRRLGRKYRARLNNSFRRRCEKQLPASLPASMSEVWKLWELSWYYATSTDFARCPCLVAVREKKEFCYAKTFIPCGPS